MDESKIVIERKESERFFLPATNEAKRSGGERRPRELGAKRVLKRSGLATPPTAVVQRKPLLKKPTLQSSLAHYKGLAVKQGKTQGRRKTKIVCTIGPCSRSPEMLLALRNAGMDVVRLNFSHGTHAYHKGTLDNLKASYALQSGPDCAIALDTKGPEIRTGNFAAEGDTVLTQGEIVQITTDKKRHDDGDAKCFWVTYSNIAKVCKVGSMVFIDDGAVCLEVVEVDPEGVWLNCLIQNTGKVSNHKGVNLPGTEVDLPAVSEQDTRDLKLAVELKVDFVFASFIRNAKGVQAIRKILGEEGKHIQIISKIENQQGIDNIDEILAASDGVMVARGDMGIEIPIQRVFLAQKMMCARANLMGKTVICATQMLESMRQNPRPTRAEVTDIANAVLDGSDCVMLSGETASGKYPVKAVSTMNEICVEAEAALNNGLFFRHITQISSRIGATMVSTKETVACSAVNAALERQACAIVCMSLTGTTAQLIAKYRPPCPIICCTPNPQCARRCQVMRGVVPVLVKPYVKNADFQKYVDDILTLAIRLSTEAGVLVHGDNVILVHGWAAGAFHTNTIRIVEA